MKFDGNGIPILEAAAPPSGTVSMGATCKCGHVIDIKVEVTKILGRGVDIIDCPNCHAVWEQRYKIGVDVKQLQEGAPT